VIHEEKQNFYYYDPYYDSYWYWDWDNRVRKSETVHPVSGFFRRPIEKFGEV
jgi:hypothetical protein